jgi:hypothetical protein
VPVMPLRNNQTTQQERVACEATQRGIEGQLPSDGGEKKLWWDKRQKA